MKNDDIGTNSANPLPPPSGASGSARPPVAPFGLRWNDTLPILLPSTVSQVLLELCREHFSGTLLLEDGPARAEVSFVHGVLVGAWDSAPEGQIGARLLRAGLVDTNGMKQASALGRARGIRVGSALLSLNLIKESTLFEQLRLQTMERLVLAVGWQTGSLRFDLNVAAARAHATGKFSVVTTILSWFMRWPDLTAIEAWFEENSELEVRCSVDFEENLASYNELAPSSVLPSILMGAESIGVGEVRRRVAAFGTGSHQRGADDLLALFHSGMLVDAMATAETRSLPRISTHDANQLDVDERYIAAVRGEWLRVQGASYYDVIGVGRTSLAKDIHMALAAQRERFDSGIAGVQLGAAASLASDIRDIYTDVESVLCDEKRRDKYDSHQQQGEYTGPKSEAIVALEEGKTALEKEDHSGALRAFERAAALDPTHPEVMAFLGWARFIQCNDQVERALVDLKRAKMLNHAALGPTLFLGLAAELVGEFDSAKSFIAEAAQNFSDDEAVIAAAKRLHLPLQSGVEQPETLAPSVPKTKTSKSEDAT